MRGRTRQGLLAAVLLVAIGCSSGDDDGEFIDPAVDMTGTWSFAASTSKPPQAAACTGTLSSFSGQPLCGSLGLEIEQDGATFTGTSTAEFCSATHTIAGEVTGTGVSGVITSSDGSDVEQVTFSGQVSGDSATFDVERLTVAGSSDFCTLTGTYNAFR